jgi:hypothetical protein
MILHVNEKGVRLTDSTALVYCKDWPGGIEYFDMYSPMFSQLYSQVCGIQLAHHACHALQ